MIQVHLNITATEADLKGDPKQGEKYIMVNY